MQAVWGSSTVEENNLNQCVSAIRKALGQQRGDHNFILTVSGVGYRFVAPVHRAEVQLRKRPSVVIIRAVVGLASVMALAAGVYAMRQRTSTAAHRRTAVILTPQILPAIPENNWLSTALGEMLYHELADPGSLRIVSLDESSRMERELPKRSSASESLRDIRRYSQADLALRGSVIVLTDRANQPLRIDLQVQDLGSGEVVATAFTEGSEQELFALVHDLSNRMHRAACGSGCAFADTITHTGDATLRRWHGRAPVFRFPDGQGSIPAGPRSRPVQRSVLCRAFFGVA
jgi:hypothetical protein